MTLSRLRRDAALLLIVDVQERLLSAMREPARVERGRTLLARAFSVLGLPIFVTEQNPTRLGATVASVADALKETNAGYEALPKMRFSAFILPLQNVLAASGRRQVVLCGIEAHVCVLQSALDLREAGYEVFLAQDAVSSRHEADERAALERMSGCGVIPASAEMLTFELLEDASAPEFKALLPWVK